MSGNAHQRRTQQRAKEAKLPPIYRSILKWLRANYKGIAPVVWPTNDGSLVIIDSAVKIGLANDHLVAQMIALNDLRDHTPRIYKYSDPDLYKKLMDFLRIHDIYTVNDRQEYPVSALSADYQDHTPNYQP